jgi:hypothetical protein
VPLQPAKVTLAGQVMDGGVVSTVLVYVWEQVAAFPQASTAWYVLTVTSVQPVHIDDITYKSNCSISATIAYGDISNIRCWYGAIATG